MAAEKRVADEKALLCPAEGYQCTNRQTSNAKLMLCGSVVRAWDSDSLSTAGVNEAALRASKGISCPLTSERAEWGMSLRSHCDTPITITEPPAHSLFLAHLYKAF